MAVSRLGALGRVGVLDRGALYVVAGAAWSDGDVYVDAATRSALSLRRVMPNLPIALFADRTVDGPFDRVIRCNERDGYRAKIVAAKASPFERTLLLDVDTYVLADLADLFRLLDQFDMALAHAPVRVSTPLADVPSAFPEFNTGVIAFRNSNVVRTLLDGWLREYDHLIVDDPPTRDQPSFRRIAYRTPALRIATLTPEYNQRFKMAGYFNQPVRLLHGWPDAWAGEADYLATAEAMTKPSATVDRLAVFAGRRVYDRTGRQVAKFHAPWNRLRKFGRPLRGAVARGKRCALRAMRRLRP